MCDKKIPLKLKRVLLQSSGETDAYVWGGVLANQEATCKEDDVGRDEYDQVTM